MKKIFLLLLVVLLVSSFAACNKKDDSSKEKEDTSSAQNLEMPEDMVVPVARERLGVPNNENITYEMGEVEPWIAEGVYCRKIVFYENGKQVASATINSQNGELLQDIYHYEKAE